MASITGVVIVIGLVVAAALNSACGVKPRAVPRPLQLFSVNVPGKTLVAATPSNVTYTFTASSAPFCLEGFLVSPGSARAIGPGQIGDVVIHLERIDSYGVSHPYLTLVSGSSGGFSPQDVVLSYGNHICANRSLEFRATQYPGPGSIDINLFGQAIFLAAPGTTITVQ
jgi:hypothetical protein